MLLSLLVVLIIFLMLIGTVLSLFFGLFGLVFGSVFMAVSFVAKYALPAIVIAWIVSQFFAKHRRLGAFIGTAVGLAIVEVVIFIILFNINLTPELVPAEDVASVTFSYHSYEKDWIEEKWETSSETTEDIGYVENMYDIIGDHTYSFTFKETFNKKKLGSYQTAELYDENGKLLSTVSLFDDRILTVKNGFITRYYKLANEDDSISSSAMSQLSWDIRTKAIEEKWGEFVRTFQKSVTCDGTEVVFQIPEIVPDGSFFLRTNLTGSYIDEAGKIQTFPMEMQWEVEKNQTWEPGGLYAINLDTRTFTKFELALSADGTTWTYDVLDILPEHLVLRAE